jgi:hypothetical protein
MEFQLYLLKTMDPPSALLSGALDRLERSEADMTSSFEVVSPLIRLMNPEQFRNLDGILEGVREESRSQDGREHIYRIPPWSEFAFKVCTDEPARFIERIGFVREGGAFREEDCPKVWKFLTCDLPGRFPNAREIDGWGHYESFIVEDSTEGRKTFLRFAWGLLQEIEEM